VLAFVVTATDHDVEAACDVLWQLGVRAIEERRIDPPELATVRGVRGTVEGGTVEGGTVELWTAVGDEHEAISRASAAIRGRWVHRVVEVGDTVDEAARTWRDFAVPIWVADDLVVVPAWQQAIGISTASLTSPSSTTSPLVVRIEPGGAFGLGDHPTTLLSLRVLRRLLAVRSDGDVDVIDVGCGTGVIAVTSALLTRRAVRAIDIASAAVEATVDNAGRNGVGALVDVDTTGLAAVDTDYDVVVANILAPVLVSLADDLRRVTRPDGRLVISGILAESHRHVLDALAPMEVLQTDVLDGWVCVELRHR
jgi:ribosomal protein L11 methyltransferase